MTKRIAFRIVIVVALFIVGFFYLLRSCLSKYDERAAIGGGGSSQSASQFLVFEKDGKGIVFSLVKFDKTVSYSQKGGSTTKSVNTTYYAQTNDLSTVAKTGTEKIKNHSQVKSYPVEIIGASGNKAWLFAGELMAYDPFTLTKLADAAIIEAKNPVLKGKLINERRYYSFDNITQQINITAADGGKYSLNTSTLIATVVDEEDISTDAAEKRIRNLNKLSTETREQRKTAYDRFRENNNRYREKKISINQYKDSTAILEKETNRLGKLLDSVEVLINEARNKKNEDDDTGRRKENARRTGSGFSGMKVNCDTMDGRWYGLFTNEEIGKVSKQFDYKMVYGDAARNKLFTTAVTLKDKNWMVDEEKTKTGTAVYLQGGFLLSKEEGLPFHLEDGFLVVHKDIVGNDGKVQLTRINTKGEQVWTINTGLKEFYDWQFKVNKLVVTGTDNKNLSSGEVNLLMVINLQNGKVAAYDFFEDKVRM